jgi:hypothetical protein
MQCPRCSNGLGIVTEFKKGSGSIEVETKVCPTCEGVGEICSNCEGNPVTCGCIVEEDKDESIRD